MNFIFTRWLNSCLGLWCFKWYIGSPAVHQKQRALIPWYSLMLFLWVKQFLYFTWNIYIHSMTVEKCAFQVLQRWETSFSPKRSPDKHQRFVMINGIYHVKYNVRNSLDKLERIASVNIKGLSWWTAFISSNTVSETALINLNFFSRITRIALDV